MNTHFYQCIKHRNHTHIYIYIYAFSRRFYPKRLTLHSSYSFYILSALAFPGNRTHDLCVANAMLYQLSYRKAVAQLELQLQLHTTSEAAQMEEVISYGPKLNLSRSGDQLGTESNTRLNHVQLLKAASSRSVFVQKPHARLQTHEGFTPIHHKYSKLF